MDGKAVARFWAKADAEDLFGCWLWTKSKDRKGYGRFRLAGRPQLASRVAYEMTVGPIPDGMQVDHRCRVPACVNPAHLRLATNKQNMENLAGVQRGSLTGVRGVRVHRGKYQVRVSHHGERVAGGTFATLAEAEAAAIALRNRLFTHNDADRMAA